MWQTYLVSIEVELGLTWKTLDDDTGFSPTEGIFERLDPQKLKNHLQAKQMALESVQDTCLPMGSDGLTF